MGARLELMVQRMENMEKRAAEAETANVRLLQESSALRASLETALRLSEEKLNGEIRLRSELQLEVKTLQMAQDKAQQAQGGQVEALQQQVGQLQRVLGEQGEHQLRLEDELAVAHKADEKAARIDAQLEGITSHAAQERQQLAEKNLALEREARGGIEAVQGELMSNAEQAGGQRPSRCPPPPPPRLI